MAEFKVLYTHQKLKKAKTWQDGVLRYDVAGTKGTLFDGSGTKLDTVYAKFQNVQTGAELETDKYLLTIEEQTNRGNPPAANNCASSINAQLGTGAAPPQKPSSAVRHGLSRHTHREGVRPAPYVVSPMERHRSMSVQSPPMVSSSTQKEQLKCQTSSLSTESDVVGFSVYGQSTLRPGSVVTLASSLGLKQLMEHHSREQVATVDDGQGSLVISNACGQVGNRLCPPLAECAGKSCDLTTPTSGNGKISHNLNQQHSAPERRSLGQIMSPPPERRSLGQIMSPPPERRSLGQIMSLPPERRSLGQIMSLLKGTAMPPPQSSSNPATASHEDEGFKQRKQRRLSESPEAHFSHLDFPDHTPTHQGHTPVIEGHTPTSQDHTLNFATSQDEGGVSSLMTTSSEHLMTMSHEHLLDGGHNYEKGGVVFQTAPTGHGHCLVPIFTGPDEWAETTPPLSLLKPTPTPLFHAAQFLSRSFEPGDFPAASEPGDFPAASEMSTYSHSTCETDPPKVTLLDPVEEGMTAFHPVGGRMNQCDPPSEGLDQYDLFDEELDPLDEGLDPLDEGMDPLGEGLDPLGEGVCQRDHSGRGMEGPVDPPSEGHDKGTTDSVPLVRSSYPPQIRSSHPPHVAGKERTRAPVLLPGLGEAGDQAEGAPPIRYTVVPPSCGKPRCASRLLKKSKKVFNSPYLLPNKQPVAGLQKSRVSKSDLCEAPGTMQLNLGGKLHFPCKEQCLQGEVPTRNTVIPHSFQDVFHYKSVLSCAVREHLNIILFTHARRYHQAMARVDMSAIDSPHLHTGTSPPPHPSPAAPHCSHGPALLRVVKKAGPNQGRMFYTCSAGGQEHCKFFKWLDKTQGDQGNRGDKSTPLMKPSSGHELDTFLKANGVSFYSSCQLVVRNSSDGPIPGRGRGHRFNPQGLQPRPQLYVSLSRRGPSSEYSKDDLWVISKDHSFSVATTFLVKSTFFGPNSSNLLEIAPISGHLPSNWIGEGHVCCIHIGNASSELTCLANTEENVNLMSLPVLHHLITLNPETTQRSSVCGSFVSPLSSASCQPWSCMERTTALNLSQEVAGQYGLNKDQTTALGKCAEMFSSSHEGPPLLLIHGVFGSGKTHLLSVMVLFLLKLFGESGVREGDTSAKILITSTTNVAVDRILTGLLDQGFEGFVRVGSVKKIAKRILPLSIHSNGGDSQELSELQEMMRSNLTPQEKIYVRKSIEQHKRGVNRKRLSSVMVVGVTTAACSFSLLEGMRFPVLLLDECSQMTEVASLIPMARFRCQKAVLVGDPKQLAPTIQGSEASHQQGLEQTLFERLVLMGHSPVLLRTQYRCHPRLSAIPNSLFYEGQLEDGVSHQDRLPLLPSLPTLCFLASNGREACAQDGSYYNSQEAQDVVSVISGLLEAGITSSNIGVITLYRAQVSHIRSVASSSDEGAGNEISAVQVSTVDAFQGGEKELILLSTVRTEHTSFLESNRRSNVALSRGKRHLLIFGHQHMMVSNTLWGHVIQLCRGAPDGIQSIASFLCALKDQRPGFA